MAIMNSGVVTVGYVGGGGVVKVVIIPINTGRATCPGVDGGWDNVTIVYRVLHYKCGRW